MSKFQKIEKGNLLLVEGPDEVYFFASLVEELSLGKEIQIAHFGGRDQLYKALKLALADTDFSLLNKLGIVRDADYNTNAFQSVCSALANANRKIPRHQFPIPDKLSTFTNDTPHIGVLRLPDEDSDGMLEDLILKACEQDVIMSCVDQYFECVETNEVLLKQHVLPKAKVRVFLSGKAVDESGSKKDKSTWWMTDIYRSDWWNWDHPAFDAVKEFLIQLAT